MAKDASLTEDNDMDSHYEYFFSTLESSSGSTLLDIAYNNEEDFPSFTAREKLLNMQLPKSSFEPLLESVKSSNPQLYTAMNQHTCLSGQSKTKRGKLSSKKEKRKERLEKEIEKDFAKSFRKRDKLGSEDSLRELSSSSTVPSGHSGSGSDTPILREERPQKKQYGEVLALVVAKSIAENSMPMYLLTVALLLMVNKEDQFKNLESYNIPVASLIAAVFEQDSGSCSSSSSASPNKGSTSSGRGSISKDEDRERERSEKEKDSYRDRERERTDKETAYGVDPQSDNDSSLFGGNSQVPRVVPNPFRNYLVSEESSRRGSSIRGLIRELRRGSSSSSKSNTTNSQDDSSSRFEVGSFQSAEDEHEATSSQYGGFGGQGEQPFSDAGSTVGSTIGSTVAELGTETASISGLDRFEEISEEDLLSQALALSMGTDVHVLSGSSSVLGSSSSGFGAASSASSGSSAPPSRTRTASEHQAISANTANTVLSAKLLASRAHTVGDHRVSYSLEHGEGEALSASESMMGEVNSATESVSMVGSGVFDPAKSVESEDNSNNSNPLAQHLPEHLPSVEPLSTFGPFCCEDFWSRIYLNTTPGFNAAHNAANNSLPTRHIIFSFLVIAGYAADLALDENSAPLHTQSSESFSFDFTDETGHSDRGEDDSDFHGNMTEESQRHRGTRVAGSGGEKCYEPLPVRPVPIVPSAFLFQMIEYLLDNLTKQLVSHCTNTKYIPAQLKRRPSEGGNDEYPLRSEDLNRDRDSDDGTVDDGTVDGGFDEEGEGEGGSPDTEWHFHLYFLVWCIYMVLKILRAHLLFASTSASATMAAAARGAVDATAFGLSTSSMGGATDRSSSNHAGEYKNDGPSGFPKVPSTSSLGSDVDEKGTRVVHLYDLMRRVLECIGIDSMPTLGQELKGFHARSNNAFSKCIDAEKGLINSANPFSHSILTKSSASLYKVSFCFSCISFRHSLRMMTIDAFTSGMSLLYTNSRSRLEVLDSLLSATPSPSTVLGKHCFTSSNLFKLIDSGIWGVAKKDSDVEKEPSSSTATATTISTATSSPSVTEVLPLAYYQLYFLRKICIAVASTKGLFVDTKPFVFNTEAEHLLGKIEDFDAVIQLLSSIQRQLISRLKDPFAFNGRGRHNMRELHTPSKFLFWEEFSFLRNVHLTLLHLYASCTLLSDRRQSLRADTDLSRERCHANLAVPEDRRVVSHHGPKLWASVVAAKGFEPNTGKYEWTVRVDKCSKGHVFLGVVTADAKTEKDSYIGVDRNGWGLIGTRSLWHNKSKVLADYGVGFSSGSIVTVKFDTDKGKLSFYTPDFDGGVAFETIPKQTIYPAYSLHEKDDKITILSCRKVMEESEDGEGGDGRAVELLTNRESQIESAFMAYARLLFDQANKILTHAEKEIAADKPVDMIVVHPFIGVLVPSIAAFIASNQYPSIILRQTTIHLMPHLTVLAKRLSKIFDLTHKKAIEKEMFEFTYRADGLWQLSSSEIASLGMPAQQYTCRIQCHGVGGEAQELVRPDCDRDSDRERRGEMNEEVSESGWGIRSRLATMSPSMGEESAPFFGAAYCVEGRGKFSSTSFEIQGSQYEAHIKFIESWSVSAGNCIVDGTLSLCGTFMSGRFKDVKSGKMGIIEGVKTSPLDYFAPRFGIGNTFKAALLCTIAGMIHLLSIVYAYISK